MTSVMQGIMIPFIGTAFGASCVFFMKKSLNHSVQHALSGFAGGVMTAAAVWSLLIPAIEQSEDMGRLSFLPASLGFMGGIFTLLIFDHIIPHMHINKYTEGLKSNLKNSTMMVLAVALHNIPEGMAVGVVYAGMLAGNNDITFADAMTLSIGIAIQNFPEGAIVSMPLKAEGLSSKKSFLCGILSGIVEPIGALITIIAFFFVAPVLPYLLGFAAGAMIYVVVEELIPEISEKPHSDIGTVFFSLGFTVMMILDVALG